MDKDKIIDGLRMTMDLCVFDPSTGEEIDPDMLNDINRATYDACKGALEILERLDTDSDTVSRQAAIDRATKEHDFFRGAVTVSDKARRDELLNVICWLGELPPAQPEIVRCKDCKYWNSGSCEYPEHAVNCQDYWVGDIETEAEHFCGYAKRREVTA